MADAKEKKSRFGFILAAFQIRLSTFLWAFLFVGVFLVWQKDRSNLERRITSLESRLTVNTAIGYGADKLLGAPDVVGAGDNPNAWCPVTMGDRQWVWLDFGKSVSAKSLDVFESCCPGTIVKVAATDWWGREKTLWSGTTKAPVAGKTKITFGKVAKIRRLKIYMDCSKVQGWNEIDSIGLVDEYASVCWPKHSKTSSSWGNANTDSAKKNSNAVGNRVFQFSGFDLIR